MKNLIIDAAKEEVFFMVITESQSYTTTYINSRENFDKFNDLLLMFLKKYKIELKDVEKIFINQGPGKLSSIRTSISISKAIALSKNITLVGFCSNDLIDNDYKRLLELESKNILNKDLINPLYSS
tara:strand:+ start:798 stop:1175 length:378 start_codon:yes stop_codon:yes gene_type:complete